VKAWTPTLMQLTSTGVYHTGAVPQGCRALDDAAGIKLADDASLVIGTFRHADGTKWVMVVNRDFKQVATPTLQFLQAPRAMQELNPATGRLDAVEMEAVGLRLQLPPGGAKLWRL
jgi:hypothetical protein